MSSTVTRTYLEMTAPQDFKPQSCADKLIVVEPVHHCPPQTFRYLYGGVGGAHSWNDRLGWSDTQIAWHLGRADVAMWVMYYGGSLAGYFELQVHPDQSVEITYFGLLPQFIGRGLGKHLLSVAIENAWRLTGTRIWLHTSTLDHQAALPNYLKRGFKPFRQETFPLAPE